MSDDLLRGLREGGYARTTARWKGLLPGLTHGGTSPRRLLNLVWLFVRSTTGLLLGRRDRVVIVRSTPPLLHLPVVTLCRWRGMRCVFWLMDYHPVIEERLWGQRALLRPLVGWLDSWDRHELAAFAPVVVLDEAMAELVRERNPRAKVLVHPTWGAALPRAIHGGPAAGAQGVAAHDVVVFAYLGNFGQGHGWATLAACIRSTARRRAVRLLTVGVPEAAEPAFATLANEVGCEWERHPRMPFIAAATLLRERGATWGCVAMRGDLAGCLSPSKFSGYLAAGVPLLYAGPPKTNAWQVCARFGGGVALNDSAEPAEVARAVVELADRDVWRRAIKGAERAREYFESFDGGTLAKLITSVGGCNDGE